MAAPRASRSRKRGTVTWLPSGSARVKVYAGVDQLTGQKLWLRETVAARESKRETEREAERVITRLLNRVDERRSPRTGATVNELLDRWLDVIDIERKTRAGYVRPTIGRLPVGKVRAETIEQLYAQLRRCRDHCRGEKFVQHRMASEHVCDEHSTRRMCAREATADPEARCRWCERMCRPHQCEALAAGSIRVVHAILSGSFTRAVRWGWIALSPVDQTEPPPTPGPTRRRRQRPRRRRFWPRLDDAADLHGIRARGRPTRSRRPCDPSEETWLHAGYMTVSISSN